MPESAWEANPPYAAAIRRAHVLAHLSLEDWTQRLAQHGARVSKDVAWKWEAGQTIVPAYGLDAAAKAVGRTLDELVNLDESPLAKRVKDLEDLIQSFRDAGYTLAAERGDRLDTLESLVLELRALPLIAAALESRDSEGQGQDSEAPTQDT